MKKKKRENGYSIPALLRQISPLRHKFFLLFLAFCGCALLLFAALAMFSPLPPIVDNHLSPHHHSSSSPPAKGVKVYSTSDAEKKFRVTARGQSFAHDLWSSSLSKYFYGCTNPSDKFQTADVKTHSNRYLLIATSGGLNQQRTGITDAVVAAYILNATLVVPKLDQKSFWNDSSNFSEIFDVDWFISYLSKDVEIIKQLPMKHGKVMTAHRMRVPRKCSPTCYQSRVLPVLNKKHAVQLEKFDYRLSNSLDEDLQKLRCRVNYHALKFTDSIFEMGKKLVERMRMKSEHFIALHLRFEPDMLAFSGCCYGGGEKERTELGKIRKRWKTLHGSDPEKERRHGKCPLTPEEVGLLLRALGFGNDVHMYVASGEVYGGEETLSPLKSLFPNFHSKETLASKEELEPFSSFSSRMAALDFIVCDESDVFVTNNNGNMAKMLAGRRRYFGHKTTIRPNAKKLYKLFMNRHNMTWEEFATGVSIFQMGFMGEPYEMKPGTGEFHENPSSCICQYPDAKFWRDETPQNQAPEDKNGQENNKRNETGDVIDERLTEVEQDLFDVDYLESRQRVQEKVVPSEIYLEDLFSD